MKPVHRPSRQQPGPHSNIPLPGSDEDETLAIVSLCAALDRIACEIYRRIAASCPAGELQAFWREMAEEEQQHVALWEQVLALSRTKKLPPLFDDADRVRTSLQRVTERVLADCGQWQSAGEVSDPLLVACRLELSMLHPAFSILFHFCWTLMGIDFYHTYGVHLNRFVEVLHSHGSNRPELELLGETLQNLWQENRLLIQQATHDELTGVLNRRGFWLLARQSAFFAQRNESRLGVLMLDLDDFRVVNERYGHPRGDCVLKAVADTLRNRLRRSDIVGRYGGEEFIILCPAVDHGALVRLAEGIRGNIEHLHTEGIRVTVSIGAVEGAIHTQSPETELTALITEADRCLYSAKHAGKNTVACGGGHSV